MMMMMMMTMKMMMMLKMMTTAMRMMKMMINTYFSYRQCYEGQCLIRGKNSPIKAKMINTILEITNQRHEDCV